MTILLIGECLPYRNCDASFDNSQGRLLASACGISVNQLQQLCTCRYVLSRHVPSHLRNDKYRKELMIAIGIDIEPMMLEYDITIFIGKRLMGVMYRQKIDFFTEYWTRFLQQESMIACIPNPLAEHWWKEDSNVAKVSAFMQTMFREYC